MSPVNPVPPLVYHEKAVNFALLFFGEAQYSEYVRPEFGACNVLIKAVESSTIPD